MKTTRYFLVASAAIFTLGSCSSAPKEMDPFDAAIEAGLGVMVGGVMGGNAGGGR